MLPFFILEIHRNRDFFHGSPRCWICSAKNFRRLFEFDVDNEKCQGEFYFNFKSVWVCEPSVAVCECSVSVLFVCGRAIYRASFSLPLWRCVCLSLYVFELVRMYLWVCEYVRLRRVAAILAIYTIVSPYSFFVFYYTRFMTIINSSFFFCNQKEEENRSYSLSVWYLVLYLVAETILTERGNKN